MPSTSIGIPPCSCFAPFINPNLFITLPPCLNFGNGAEAIRATFAIANAPANAAAILLAIIPPVQVINPVKKEVVEVPVRYYMPLSQMPSEKASFMVSAASKPTVFHE